MASAPNSDCGVETHQIVANGDEDQDDDDDDDGATVPLLLNLPTELILEVVLWVVGPTRRGVDAEGTDAEDDPARDAAALAASCKQLHDLVVHSAVIWRALAINSFVVVEEASSDGPSFLLPMAWDNCTWKEFLILLRHISCQPHELWAVGVVLLQQPNNNPNGGPPHQNVIFPTRSKCVELTIPSLPFALLFFFPYYHHHQSNQDEAFGVLVRACYDNKHPQQQQHTSDAQLCIRMEEQLINGARKQMKSRYITGGPKVEAGLFGSSQVLPCHHHHHHVMNETDEDQSMLSLLYWYLCHPYDHCFEHLLLHPPWPPSHYSVAMGARRVSKLLVVHHEEEEEEQEEEDGEDNALGHNKMHSPTTTTTTTQLRVRLERRC